MKGRKERKQEDRLDSIDTKRIEKLSKYLVTKL